MTKLVVFVTEGQVKQLDKALAFMWYSEAIEEKQISSIAEVLQLFNRARLHKPNGHRLASALRAHPYIRRLPGNRFELTATGLRSLEKIYGQVLAVDQSSIPMPNEMDLLPFPYIDERDLAAATRMQELYIQLFCLENSIRRHIESTLSNALGSDWWEQAASQSMKKKQEDRMDRERKNRWAPARSDAGPLYALDYADLVTLMRRYEHLFRASLGHISFLHRVEDLGALRNVIAHNGVIADESQFQRVRLVYEDWRAQLSGDLKRAA